MILAQTITALPSPIQGLLDQLGYVPGGLKLDDSLLIFFVIGCTCLVLFIVFAILGIRLLLSKPKGM